MGKAKEEWAEQRRHEDVAEALGIQPSELEGYGYEILEDTDRSGITHRTFVRWEDEVPDGVEEDIDGTRETTIILPVKTEPDED